MQMPILVTPSAINAWEKNDKLLWRDCVIHNDTSFCVAQKAYLSLFPGMPYFAKTAIETENVDEGEGEGEGEGEAPAAPFASASAFPAPSDVDLLTALTADDDE